MTGVNALTDLFPPRVDTEQRGANSVEDLGSEAFLQLMVAQLENQDPSKPIDNTEFVAQLAQFGTVSGVQELNESFDSLGASLAAGQGWQAASLIGRSVVGETNLGQLNPISPGSDELQLSATIDFDGTTTGGTVYVQDATGSLVFSDTLPAGVSGEYQFEWNGLDNDGEALPPGRYRVSAEAVQNGQPVALSAFAHLGVDSVVVDSTTGDITLNLSDGTSVPVAQVRQFL